MSDGKRKKLKNRYSKWAKKSPYKTLQLLECFARDLSIRETARITKMSERTVRDRFAELRGKLLDWVMKYPDRFNGFGHLLLDPDGSINSHVLQALILQTKTSSFKQRMAERYPRFRTDKDPALEHVIEFAVRRFTQVEPPQPNEEFKAFVKNADLAAKGESAFQAVRHKPSASSRLKTYWNAFRTRLFSQNKFRARKFPTAAGEAFFRDLKYCLRREPL